MPDFIVDDNSTEEGVVLQHRSKGISASAILLSTLLSGCSASGANVYATQKKSYEMVQWVSLLHACGFASQDDNNAAMRVAVASIGTADLQAKDQTDWTTIHNNLTTRQAQGAEEALDERQCIRISRTPGKDEEAKNFLVSLRRTDAQIR